MCVNAFCLCKSSRQAIRRVSIGSVCENDIDTEKSRGFVCMRVWSAHTANRNIYDPSNTHRSSFRHTTYDVRVQEHEHIHTQEREREAERKSTSMQTPNLTLHVNRHEDRQHHRRPWRAQPVVIVLFYLATASEDINLSVCPPQTSISMSEGDLAYLSVSSHDTGPISNTSCRLCIGQMLHKPSSGWSVRHACFVQYANNHMQITHPCACVTVYQCQCKCSRLSDVCVNRRSYRPFSKYRNVIVTHMQTHTHAHTHQKLWPASCCAATRDVL